MRSLNTPLLTRSTGVVGFVKPGTMGKLFVAILLVVVFEGAFRKWISPALTFPLVFLRDSLACYGIYWAAKQSRKSSFQTGTQAMWVWTVVVVLWGTMQLMVNQSSLIVLVMGIRFWLLYLLFAYTAAVSMSADDFRYITKSIMYLMLVMAPLAVLQYFSPPSSFFNREVVGDEEVIFRVSADIVRTTGTFSFTLGYATFLALATPFVFSIHTPGSRLLGNKWMPKVILFALASATIVSGSRAALIMFSLLFIVFIVVSLRYLNTGKKQNNFALLVTVVLTVLIIPFVYSSAVDSSRERFETAAEVEDFSGRVETLIFGEDGTYENFTLIGNGIGTGTLFAGVAATGERTFMLAETEAARTILEGGLLGFTYIGLKLIVIIIGLFQSVRIAKSNGNSLPLLLWFTLAIGLLTWSIIGQLTVNALGYLLFGLGVASLRFNANR